jgi:hypothetical protein
VYVPRQSRQPEKLSQLHGDAYYASRLLAFWRVKMHVFFIDVIQQLTQNIPKFNHSFLSGLFHVCLFSNASLYFTLRD